MSHCLRITPILCLLFVYTFSFGQTSSEYWKTAVAEFNSKNFKSAIENFKKYDALQPQKSNAQFYLANAYYQLKMLDSATLYYSKTLEYHNSSRPNKTCMLQLSRSYLQQKDFEKAYTSALEAFQKFPDDESFALEFRDVCLWSYLVRYHNLNEEYLTNYKTQTSYIVNSIAEQRVISSNLRNEDGFKFIQDKRKNVGFAQRWYGTFENAKEVKSIHFIFTNPDYMEALEQQEEVALKILQDINLPTHERLGAFYFLAPFDNKKMALILEQADLSIRYCACNEIRSYISKKLKKICSNDERPLIQEIVKLNPALTY